MTKELAMPPSFVWVVTPPAVGNKEAHSVLSLGHIYMVSEVASTSMF